MRLYILFFLVFFHLVAVAQVNKMETYHTGTKVTYYPNSCESDMPEAEGKISFCDRAGNLGVVEKSFGLNSPRVDKMAFNYYNNDEIYLTQSGVSIRKEDGSWDNFHNYTGPRSTVTSNAPSAREVLLGPDGKLFFYHGSMFGLHALNLETKEFENFSYSTTTGGSNNRYTVAISHDEQSDTTYVLSAPGGSSGSHYVYAYFQESLYYKGSIPISKTSSGITNEKFLVKDGYFYIGGNSGLYKINTQDLADFTLYNSGNLLPLNRIDDMQFDEQGALWLAMNSNNNGALVRFIPDEETVDVYQFPDPSNANINLRFNGIAVDSENTIWAVALNESGFGKLMFDDQGGADFEFFPEEYFSDLGFPFIPNAVFRHNNKIYFLARNTTGEFRYEAVINDNGSWYGVSDDDPSNISARFTQRYSHGYPAEEGVWFFNRYEERIAYWDQNDNFKRQYNMGNIRSMVVDNDNNPVWSDGSQLKKFDQPNIYEMQDPETHDIRAIRRYKDLIYAFDRANRKILVYRNNLIVANYQLDEADYGSLFDFNVDSYGNPWFYKLEDGNLWVKKFDITTQTTTNLQASTGGIRYLEGIISMPNGQMCFLGASALVIYHEGEFTMLDSDDFSYLSRMKNGVADVDGNLRLFTHDLARIVTVKNPLNEEPIFDNFTIEGQYDGALPYVRIYRPNGMMLDMVGNFWAFTSGKWLKITFDDPVPPFLNYGESYGITGRVFVDVNENSQFDSGEEYVNQKVSLVSGEQQFDTYTNEEGKYFFSFMGENTDYSITLPSINNYVTTTETQQQIEVNNFEENFEVDDFMLQPKNISSLVVKSSAKEGLWGFERDGFENSFTTAISNLSFTDSFSDLELQFVFIKEGEDLDWDLPEIEDIKVHRIIPNGNFHLIPWIYINPKNHYWEINANPDTYTTEEMEINPAFTESEEGIYIDFALGTVGPLETFLIEIDTDLFPPEKNGVTLKYGIRIVKSPDFSDDTPSGTTVFIFPSGQDPRAGGFDEMSPYTHPDDIYSEPPYRQRKDVYADSPYSSRIYSSYDPNDKLVTPGLPDEVNLTDIDKKWLTYTLRFQNDGNFSAKDVFITDKIDENLDLNTLSLIEHSHPMQMSQTTTEDSVWVKFSFNDIYLDYSENDLEASQGYVKFMIKAHDTIPLGTIVENAGAIYFDQNPPIYTNVVRNEFVELSNLGLLSNPPQGGEVNFAVAGEYFQGEQVALKAQANEAEEYNFVNWTLDGEEVSDTSSFIYTMAQTDALLVANFEKEGVEMYSVNINVEPAEGGEAMLKVNDDIFPEPYNLEAGTEFVLEAVPADGYVFSEWQLGEESYTENSINFTSDSSLSITLKFELIAGISDNLQSEEPNIYPNPADRMLQISAPFIIQQYAIINSQGQLVEHKTIDKEETNLSVARFNEGIYFLKIYSVEKVYFRKIQILR